MPAQAPAIIVLVKTPPERNAAMMSSKTGTVASGCGTQNISQRKKVTTRPPAPRAARKWSGDQRPCMSRGMEKGMG